jgi:hypothetical protein
LRPEAVASLFLPERQKRAVKLTETRVHASVIFIALLFCFSASISVKSAVPQFSCNHFFWHGFRFSAA